MPLSAGTRLGPYQIVAPLGAGGMGEVYRARDSRLGREVAVKVLPEHLSSNPETRARFEREARTVSALNHPYICTLFDVGREGETDFLVMELVEGETLAARIGRGALPTAEVLKIGAQIADALDRAHRAGVVHRDLKPGNVMLTKSGAKLMDFGLARATGLAGSGSGSDAMATTLASPAMGQPLTAEGTIVGTFQYMSPEQLEGNEADARADLWALGCVLYEMATGRRAFVGKSQASVIGAIMNTEPAAIATIAPMIPPAFDRLVHRCLVKDPDDRWQSARDILHELQWIGGDTASQQSAAVSPAAAQPAPGIPQPRASKVLFGWAILATLAFATVVVLMIVRGRTPTVGPASIEFTLDPPPGYTFVLPSDPALSPDGRTVVCVVADSVNNAQLAIRPLDHAAIRVLPGTFGASLPFWAPDGRSVGFFSQGKLRKLTLDGGVPVAIADAADGRGAAWSKDGTIVFVPTAGGCVFAVPAAGGSPVQVTTLDAGREEVGHRYPCVLPDGRHFLYVAFGKSGKKWLCEGDVAGGPSRVLGETETAMRWGAPGWLLTVDRRRVMAQRFDEDTRELRGAAVEVAQCGGIPKYGHANLAVAANGTLVYQRPWKLKAWLRWYDASGQPISDRGHGFESPLDLSLAPDHRTVAMTLAADNDIWLLDLDHPVPKRLTFFNLPQFNALQGLAWSPDSRRIAFTVGGTGGETIHVISTETAVDSTLFAAPNFFANPQSWSSDGRTIVALCTDVRGNFDIWTIPVENPKAATPFLETPEYEQFGKLSPDGRWLACQTSVGGDVQVRIYSMQRPGVRYQLVLEGNTTGPFWSADGRNLILVDSNRQVIVVPVQLEGSFRQGESRKLFELPLGAQLVEGTSDLRRFLVVESEVQSNPAPLCVLTSWPERLSDH